MQLYRIDILNIALIGISFFLAIMLPVELFLFSYAVLGPLHYLTEIGWLEQRNYFTKDRKDIWVLFVLSVVITLAFIISNSDVIDPGGAWTQVSWFNSLNEIATQATGGVIFFAFCAAMSFALISNRRTRYISILIAFLVALFVHKVQPVWLMFGAYIPTIIHVSIFTGLFMLYGALKSRSKWGYASTALFFIAMIAFFLIDLEPSSYTFSSANTQRLLDSTFIHLGASMAQYIGLHENGASYTLMSPLGLKIQALFAFCYTYHYLNWFSKTKIINWHAVSKRWLIFTAIVWVASMGLYFINYKIGLLALFFLSLLHVFLEFPLNHLSIVGIWQELRRGKLPEVKK